MSVLIKGFNAPKDGCKDCAMVQRGGVVDICPFLKQEVNGNVERGGKPNGCPIVEASNINVGDTIYRQEAIEALSDAKGSEEYHNEYEDGYNDGIDFAISTLSTLSPAQSEGWMERNKERILQAGLRGQEVEFRIGGRKFAIRELAQ